MLSRSFIRSLVVLLFLVGCGSSQTSPTTVERSASCPAPGTRLPYAQLLAQTRSFVGCDIETEVSFVGVGMGGLVGGNTAREGHSIFRVTPPGQSPSSGPLGMDFSFLTLPDSAAGPLFSASAGKRFVVRGSMEMQADQGGVETGNWGRTLRGVTAQAAP